MNTLIAAGGTGSRTLEALLHLCAVGQGPREPLRVLVVDPDRANGNARRVTELANTYVMLQKSLGGKLGPDLQGQPLRLFGTVVDLLGDRLRVWWPAGPGETLLRSIDHPRLAGPYAGFRDVARLLFTSDSLDLRIDVGSHGRPAIAAVSLALMSDSAHETPWSLLLRSIQEDVLHRREARVFVVGSMFGGTAPSAIHAVVRFLRSAILADRGQVRIGVGALTPYFTFVDEGDAARPLSHAFPLATRAAIEFYAQLREHGDWPYDAMYWIGDSDPVRYAASHGGDTQENPAHFCELLAAFAAADFFNHDVSGGRCYYAGPRQLPFAPELGEKNVADWDDIPRVAGGHGDATRDAMRLFLMAMTHTGFWADVLADPRVDARPECVPWYRRRFSRRSLYQNDRPGVETLGSYFRDHFFRWWDEVLKLDRTRYFNRALWTNAPAVLDLAGRRNLRWPNDPRRRIADFDDFFESMVFAERSAAGEHGLAQYVAMLAHAADAYLQRHAAADVALGGG